jgi:hypothetical protein
MTEPKAPQIFTCISAVPSSMQVSGSLSLPSMTYHAVTVTLEDITGITANKSRSGNTQSLNFNVTVQGTRQYAVLIRGAPRLESGTVVTAVLRDPSNWQTLIGWLDHSTGETFGIDSPGELLWRCLFAAAIGLSFAVTAFSERSGVHRTVLLLLAVAMNVCSIGWWLRSVRAYRLLRP